MSTAPGHDVVKVEGLSQFVRALKAAGVDVMELKDANQSAGNYVLSAATARAPRRKGVLAGSGRASRVARGAVVRFGSARVPYAGPIHWGWPARHIRSQPFAVEAAKAAEPVWIRFYARDLEQLVAKVEAATN